MGNGSCVHRMGVYGQWVVREADGRVTEETYMNGILHGPYVFESKTGRMYKGSYVNGKKHGRWIYRYYRDEPVEEVTYVNGEEQ